MKIRDLLTEATQGVSKENQASIPDMSSVGVPPLPMGPTNFYHKYRLGVHMAGSPADEHPYPTQGEFVDDMVMVGYSNAERDIISNSVKAFGYTPKQITPKGSQEPHDTHKVSPVSSWNTPITSNPSKYGKTE
jgi:hypothetical protein